MHTGHSHTAYGSMPQSPILWPKILSLAKSLWKITRDQIYWIISQRATVI